MAKVAVTGCAGFVGSHLVHRLLEQGHEVTGVDFFLDNYPQWVKENNMKRFRDHPSFTWVQSDLDKMDLIQLLQGKDYLFHQAALPGVRSSWGKDFQLYVIHNISVTQKLLEAVKHTGIRKMIYASTSSVYGLTNGPTQEDQKLSPFSPYGVSKLSGEQLCGLYFANYNVPVVMLRYFTVYGPGQRPDMAFHKFLKNMMENKEIIVYGDGKQTRDFTYIDDVVNANLLALEHGRNGEAYNIGGSSPVELIDVISLMGKITGKNPILKFEREQYGDPKHTWADIAKARAELSYDPSVSLEYGLQQEANYIASLYGL
ncbi:NAD-dependent epimerase/dehydratase family protein [Paenibacillus thailandensis]|uniref:NAD-dependent epimerase/dehydratase family protein n=1 Tax=Paenibacillus thailandensis TaxID=393250 RepID=A0ABW5QVW3_9BACL